MEITIPVDSPNTFGIPNDRAVKIGSSVAFLSASILYFGRYTFIPTIALTCSAMLLGGRLINKLNECVTEPFKFKEDDAIWSNLIPTEPRAPSTMDSLIHRVCPGWLSQYYEGPVKDRVPHTEGETRGTLTVRTPPRPMISFSGTWNEGFPVAGTMTIGNKISLTTRYDRENNKFTFS